MRERFAKYSGEIDFGTHPGEGFEIRGVMPVLQA
jgi:signal transduction histidine kinase